MFKGIYVK